MAAVPTSRTEPDDGPAPQTADPSEPAAPGNPASEPPPNDDRHSAELSPPPDLPEDSPAGPSSEPVIDPELASLPAPPHSHPTNGSQAESYRQTMTITESIASAPNPRTADFSMEPLEAKEIDIASLDKTGDGIPGSPTAKVMRAIAPPNATQPDPKWPLPPPNASVNLFIGRALLSEGNDNWPLKPNDIVNWIRKHYPAEWDGDEGRCSAHRVRTYLARKGADMYYEKLNQGCIAGWRIRQNHLWRFENGGFQGRGMKQEEAIAQQQKENEMIATAAHKAAAAEALAAGHPSVKTSMSQPGISDGLPLPPPSKKLRIKTTTGGKKKNKAKEGGEGGAEMAFDGEGEGEQSLYRASDPNLSVYSSLDPGGPQAGSSTGQSTASAIDPLLMAGQQPQHVASQLDGSDEVDINIVHQAMQAAAAANASGPMDELDMGMQLPIEMQLHVGEHDDGGDDGSGYPRSNYGAYQGGHHPYTPHQQAFDGTHYGYTNGQQFGQTGYPQGP